MPATAKTQNSYLTNYARKLGPLAGAFIADQVFPVVDVKTKRGNFHDVSGGFGAQSPGHLMAIANGQDRPLTIDVQITDATGWNVDDNGLGALVKASAADMARGDGLDLAEATTSILTTRTLQIRERIAAGLAFSTTTFSGKTAALSGTDQWSHAASDPSGQAQDAIDNVIQQSGEAPDSLIVGYEVHKQLVRHPQLRELLKHSTAEAGGVMSNARIAAFLGVENYYVGMAVGNTAVEGQTASKGYIWGKFALFCRLRQSPAPMTPQSCLQRFRLEGSMDGEVRAYDLPGGYTAQIDRVWCDQFAAPTTELGYLYSTVVA